MLAFFIFILPSLGKFDRCTQYFCEVFFKVNKFQNNFGEFDVKFKSNKNFLLRLLSFILKITELIAYIPYVDLTIKNLQI